MAYFTTNILTAYMSFENVFKLKITSRYISLSKNQALVCVLKLSLVYHIAGNIDMEFNLRV